jgi:OmpA-OmpF porin, OOP family
MKFGLHLLVGAERRTAPTRSLNPLAAVLNFPRRMMRANVSKESTVTPAATLLMLMLAVNAFADATIPTADKKGSKDNPLLKRYEGSFIVVYEQQSFGEFTLPLSRLEAVPDKRDSHNNDYFEPKQKKSLEGAYTRIVYFQPANRSPLEVLRNYQQEIKSGGGKILFECKADECGGDATRSSEGGGGKMSLAMYLYPADRVKDEAFSNGSCALTSAISDQRFTSAEMPSVGAHVSILTYTINNNLYCKAFNERTIAIVDIVEEKAREQKMVTVKAEDMAQQIASSGSVALYGIYFDFNKADVKTESTPTLEQIAKLLKSTPRLKVLVVGHTDNVGSFASNMDLSQRRAASVVNVLATKFQIEPTRLAPVGVAFASPVASNKSEDGRAKNRRVALVEH